jgi:hypothetical protein
MQSARAWVARARNHRGLVNELWAVAAIGRLPRAVASALHQTPEHEEVVNQNGDDNIDPDDQQQVYGYERLRRIHRDDPSRAVMLRPFTNDRPMRVSRLNAASTPQVVPIQS